MFIISGEKIAYPDGMKPDPLCPSGLLPADFSVILSRSRDSFAPESLHFSAGTVDHHKPDAQILISNNSPSYLATYFYDPSESY